MLVLVRKPAVQERAHREPYDLVAEMLELLVRLDNNILTDLQVAGVMRQSLSKEGRLLEFMPDDGGQLLEPFFADNLEANERVLRQRFCPLGVLDGGHVGLLLPGRKTLAISRINARPPKFGRNKFARPPAG